jgi:hypothetical protein
MLAATLVVAHELAAVDSIRGKLERSSIQAIG